MKTRSIGAVVVAGLVGLAIFQMEWLLAAAGVGLQIPRSESLITVEYWIGFPTIAILAYFFPGRAVLCSVAFLWVPIILRHSIHIYTQGIPNLWPVELLLIALLTLPYIAVAYVVAYIRRPHDLANVT